MATICFSLGSNMGDRRSNLDQAIEKLIVECGLIGVRISAFYETDPIGYTDQEAFLNCVVMGRTSMEPFDVLEITKGIEQELKRNRKVRWGPRTLDVDILLYDDLEQDDPELTIPHPRILERAFVLIPLLEIWPDAVVQGQKVTEILPALAEQKVRKLES